MKNIYPISNEALPMKVGSEKEADKTTKTCNDHPKNLYDFRRIKNSHVGMFSL